MFTINSSQRPLRTYLHLRCGLVFTSFEGILKISTFFPYHFALQKLDSSNDVPTKHTLFSFSPTRRRKTSSFLLCFALVNHEQNIQHRAPLKILGENIQFQGFFDTWKMLASTLENTFHSGLFRKITRFRPIQKFSIAT